MSGITVNEELLNQLTSDYAKEYNNLPNTHKQAIQWAYEKGYEKAVKDFASKMREQDLDLGDYHDTTNDILEIVDKVEEELDR